MFCFLNRCQPTLLLLIACGLTACATPANAPPAAQIFTPTAAPPTIDPTPTRPTATPPTPTPANTPTATPTTPPSPFTPLDLSPFGGVTHVALSDDGRFAAVIDANRLFLYDARTGQATPLGPAAGRVAAAGISPDGRTVAYWGMAEEVNDIPDEAACRDESSPVCGHLFVYDVTTGATVSYPFGVRMGGLDGPYGYVSVANGGVVAVGGNGVLRTGTFLIAPGAEPQQISEEASAVALTSDGRTLAYLTAAGPQVYDAATGVSTAVAAPWSESASPFEIGAPQLDVSDDGRYLVLASLTNLADSALASCTHIPDQELPFCRHVYLIDRQTNGVELVSVSDSGQPANGVSLHAYVSGDGRFVLFDSYADNLTDQPVCPERFTRCPQVYLRDRAQGRTLLLGRAPDGQAADDGRWAGDLTTDAALAAIISDATGFIVDVNAVY